MSREGLDLTSVGGAVEPQFTPFSKFRALAIGASAAGEASARMLDIDQPDAGPRGPSFAQGVPSVRATSAEELVTALGRSYATPEGPMFI